MMFNFNTVLILSILLLPTKIFSNDAFYKEWSNISSEKDYEMFSTKYSKFPVPIECEGVSSLRYRLSKIDGITEYSKSRQIEILKEGILSADNCLKRQAKQLSKFKKGISNWK